MTFGQMNEEEQNQWHFPKVEAMLKPNVCKLCKYCTYGQDPCCSSSNSFLVFFPGIHSLGAIHFVTCFHPLNIVRRGKTW